MYQTLQLFDVTYRWLKYAFFIYSWSDLLTLNNKLTLGINIGRLLLSKPIIAQSNENMFASKMFLEKGASKYHNHNINSACLGGKQLKLTPRVKTIVIRREGM